MLSQQASLEREQNSAPSISFDLRQLPLQQWLQNHRTRRELKALQQNDPSRLSGDLGLDPVAVELECRKPFWKN